MKYYLQTKWHQLNEITPQTYGRVIKDLERFGYNRAASILRDMRAGAQNNAPHICTPSEVKALRMARGATVLTKDVLAGYIGDNVTDLTLKLDPLVRTKPVRLRTADNVAICPPSVTAS